MLGFRPHPSGEKQLAAVSLGFGGVLCAVAVAGRRGRLGAVALVMSVGLATAGAASSGPGVWTSSRDLQHVNVQALAVDPTRPSIAYAATYKSGLFKTTDGGRTWHYSGIGQGVRSLAVDPRTPSTVYAGTWRRGLAKSTDGGVSWKDAGLDGWGVLAIALDPQTPTTLYAGTEKAGVFKSTDGGENWVEMNAGLGRRGYVEVLALAIHPGIPTTIYASTGYGRNELLKSTNGGRNWRPAGLGAPVGALVIDPTRPAIVYAGTYGRAFETFKSTDGGRNWRPVAGMTGASVRTFVVDPRNTRIIYAGTTHAGVLMSPDGGRRWSAFNRGLEIPRSSGPGRRVPAINTLAIAATGRVLYAGTAGGGVFAHEHSR